MPGHSEFQCGDGFPPIIPSDKGGGDWRMVTRHSDYLVTTEFYKLIVERFPILKHNPGYRHLLGYILFGTWVDADTGELIIHRHLLADMEGKRKQSESANFRGRDLTDGFSRDVFHLQCRCEDIYKEVAARRIVHAEVPEDIRKASLEQVGSDGSLVWLGSGEQPGNNDAFRERMRLEAHALEFRAKAKSREATEILDYLNGLPPARFTSLVKRNLRMAVRTAKALPSERSRERELKLLKAIAQQPKPYYKTVPNSVRLYGLNPSLLRLEKGVRLALTDGWVHADLRAAQLAIIAKLWHCPKAVEIVESGNSIWSLLHAHLGWKSADETKALLKESLYRIAFGAGDDSLRAFWYSEGHANEFDLFMKNEIIAEVWSARERVKDRLNDEEVLTDAFGNKLVLDKNAKLRRVPETAAYYTQSNALSLMAQQAQSYELRLIWPAFELAKSFGPNDRHGIVITSFLFDGFSFISKDSNDIEKWKGRLSEVINEQAVNLGIDTKLEFS